MLIETQLHRNVQLIKNNDYATAPPRALMVTTSQYFSELLQLPRSALIQQCHDDGICCDQGQFMCELQQAL